MTLAAVGVAVFTFLGQNPQTYDFQLSDGSTYHNPHAFFTNTVVGRVMLTGAFLGTAISVAAVARIVWLDWRRKTRP